MMDGAENCDNPGEENETVQKSFQEILEVMRSYESLLANSREEIDSFRNDHKILKKFLLELLEENKRLNEPKVDKSGINADPVSIFKKTYVAMADKLINNLKNQLIYVNKEKQTFESLWRVSQSAVKTLETEVRQYKIHLNKQQPESLQIVNNLKKEYTNELRRLEENSKKLELEILRQKEENQKCLEQLDTSEKENQSLKDKIKELEAEKSNLEEMVKEANDINRAQVAKNTETLKKLEETIEIAEKSMQEINRLIQEKDEVQEELNYLSNTISEVMQESARKLDQEREIQNANHQKQILKLEQEILKHQKLLEVESRKREAAVNKSQMLTETNSYLDHDLKIAFNQVENTELKLKALEKTILNEQKTSKLCEEQVGDLQYIIKKKNEYKQVYHNLLMKVMKVLENLSTENRRLKSELNSLKNSRE